MRVLLCFVFLPELLLAQAPRIGIVDFYGLREISESEVRAALGITVGDPVPTSTDDIVERLEQIPGVVRAHIGIVCCIQGGEEHILYVGIQEKDGLQFKLRAPPHGPATLPEEVVDTYHAFGKALHAAVLKGDAGDDLSQGHSLMKNSEARAVQERFLILAKRHLEILRTVLRSSVDGNQRAIAANVLGYVSDKRSVLDDLLYAVRDPADNVRNNTTRAIGAIANLANRQPELGIRISPTPFIRMLNSVVWADRNKALMVLSIMTSGEDLDSGVLQDLQKKALQSLVEMARWKSPGHSLSAYALLGRVAGIPDDVLARSMEGRR